MVILGIYPVWITSKIIPDEMGAQMNKAYIGAHIICTCLYPIYITTPKNKLQVGKKNIHANSKHFFVFQILK